MFERSDRRHFRSVKLTKHIPAKNSFHPATKLNVARSKHQSYTIASVVNLGGNNGKSKQCASPASR
jgi:hypothetical protein